MSFMMKKINRMIVGNTPEGISSGKKLLYIILIPAVILLIYIFFYSHSRDVKLYDYRLTYSDEYKVKSESDLRIIDEVIDNMILIQTDNNSISDFRLGGFILIEESRKDMIESYRVQGEYVTKYTYKETYDHIISTTYYSLDEKYYVLLGKLCDKNKK